MKAVYAHFDDEEFELLLKAKGNLTWHDFILLNTVGIATTYQKAYQERIGKKHG